MSQLIMVPQFAANESTIRTQSVWEPATMKLHLGPPPKHHHECTRTSQFSDDDGTNWSRAIDMGAPVKASLRPAGFLVEGEVGSIPDMHDPLEILTWPQWQRWAQVSFNTQFMRCPSGCAFSGTPAQTLEHSARLGKRRAIACPGVWCQVIASALPIENHHVATGTLRGVHCLT